MHAENTVAIIEISYEKRIHQYSWRNEEEESGYKAVGQWRREK